MKNVMASLRPLSHADFMDSIIGPAMSASHAAAWCTKEPNARTRPGPFSIMMAMAFGSDEQRAMAQSALNRWWWPSLMMFGPHDADSEHSSRSMEWKIKRQSNDELRQAFIDQTVSQTEVLKLSIPDPDLSWNESTGHYDIGEIDWAEFQRVVAGNGPCNRARLAHHQAAHESGAWVREAVRGYQQTNEGVGSQ